MLHSCLLLLVFACLCICDYDAWSGLGYQLHCEYRHRPRPTCMEKRNVPWLSSLKDGTYTPSQVLCVKKPLRRSKHQAIIMNCLWLSFVCSKESIEIHKNLPQETLAAELLNPQYFGFGAMTPFSAPFVFTSEGRCFGDPLARELRNWVLAWLWSGFQVKGLVDFCGFRVTIEMNAR